MTSGTVFDVKRFAVHDGPGVRTTVFLKGCPLRCRWCHNPEAMRARPEIVFTAERCIGCGECFEACSSGALSAGASAARKYDRERCELCGACARSCYAGAVVMEGREVSVGDVLAEVLEDAAFYEASGGGVTLSGGEPLMQAEFAAEILRRCRAESVGTALDTSGEADWAAFEAVLPHCDLVLYDLKHVDPARHREHTGVSNERIIGNLRRLDRAGSRIEVRMPVIPTVNGDRESVEAAAALLGELTNLVAVRLLPYHRLGAGKRERLGLRDTMPPVDPPPPGRMAEVASWMSASGVEATVAP